MDTYTLVMSYVPGGTLEDVLESCLQGGMVESDVRWWFAQAVCAIGWLHEQGWAHRYVLFVTILPVPPSMVSALLVLEILNPPT